MTVTYKNNSKNIQFIVTQPLSYSLLSIKVLNKLKKTSKYTIQGKISKKSILKLYDN